MTRWCSLLFFGLFICSNQVWSQSFSAELTGNPVNTTGWTFATGTSYVSGDMFVLTNPIGNQAGYIYYATPQDLTLCARFTVDFEFRITEHSAVTADGITFWYITNPPTGFATGGGIGLPNNPNGLLLIMDTYNNDGVVDNPLVTLRVLDGTSNYAEGSATGRLAPDLINQGFIIDNNWHSCRLTYNYGNIEVSFDGGPAVMSGYTALNMTGYFGFSSGTGGSWSRQVIRNVRINGAPNPDPPATSDTAYCQFETPVQLHATGDSIRWYEAASGGVPLPDAPTPNTSVPGVYTWYVTQTITGCPFESDRLPVTVTVYEEVSALFEDTLRYGCAGDTLFITYNTPAVGIYRWDFGDGSPVTGRVPYHVYTTPGTYQATLVVENGLCRDSAATTVIIRPFMDSDFTVDADSICQGDSVRFASQVSGEELIYYWNFGDGTTDTVLHPVHTYTLAGVFDAMLVVRDFRECSDTIVKTVFVDSFAGFGLTVSDTVLCTGTVVHFSTDYRPTGSSSIMWDMGDGTEIADTTVLRYPYEQPGDFHVTLTASYPVCPDTVIPLTIRVHPYPVVKLPPDTVLCPGDAPLLLYNQASPPENGRHLWSTGDAGAELAVSIPGTYWLQVTNGEECSTTDSIDIYQSCHIGIPNVFTPGGDGVNDYFFPRQILSRAVRSFRMQVFNRWGQKVFETTRIDGRGWDGRLNGADQPQDVYVYLVEVTFANGVQEKHQGNVTLLR